MIQTILLLEMTIYKLLQSLRCDQLFLGKLKKYIYLQKD